MRNEAMNKAVARAEKKLKTILMLDFRGLLSANTQAPGYDV